MKLREPLPLIQRGFGFPYGHFLWKGRLKGVGPETDLKKISWTASCGKDGDFRGDSTSFGMNHMNWDMWVPLKNSRQTAETEEIPRCIFCLEIEMVAEMRVRKM